MVSSGWGNGDQEMFGWIVIIIITITYTGKACKAHRRRKAARVLKPLKTRANSSRLDYKSGVGMHPDV
jgi:hypothetical protein